MTQTQGVVNRTWKQEASMAAKAEMESQALNPEGKALPLEAAKATNNSPDGISLNAATTKGPVLGRTSFIATIAVPQKKKGDIRSPHSNADSTNAAAVSPVSPLSCSDSSLITHSTSSPVPMQSISSESVLNSDSVALLLAKKLDGAI